MQHQNKISEEKYEGVIKWFSMEKGFGFITPDKSLKKNRAKNDIFVHISSLNNFNVIDVNEGNCVTFNLEESDNGRTCAVNVDIINE